MNMNKPQIIDSVTRLVNVPTQGTVEFKKWIEQKDFIDFLNKGQVDQDFILYSGLTGCFINSVLVPADLLDKPDINDIMKWSFSAYDSWRINHTFPEPDKPIEAWIENPLDSSGSKTLSKGESIIFIRNFDGRSEDKSYLEINQKITHTHDLHYVPERSAYCRFDKEGDIEDVISLISLNGDLARYGSRITTIKRNVLDLHLALTKSIIIRVFDSTRIFRDNFMGWGKISENLTNDTDNKLFYRLGIDGRNGSYIRGFQIIDCSQPRELILKNYAYGDEEDKKYETFIANDWKHSKIHDCSCDPNKLGNYFVESDLPFGISPVFFKPEVLNKYKADQDKYKIDNRSIACRNVWHLQTYDINESGQIHTYLKYLGDLPYAEQRYWKSFNESPKGGISKRAFTNDFKGDFDFTYDPLPRIKAKLKSLQEQNVGWWQMNSHESIERLHYPVTNSDKEWSDEIMALDQLVVEGFNHSYLKSKAKQFGCDIDPQWGSLKLLKEVLIAQGFENDHADSIIEPLRELQYLRTKMKAHSSGQETKAIRAKLIRQHGSLKKQFRELVTQCDNSINNLVEISDKGSL